ncbi:MAG: SHOCT domain-containing protein [gamma proteobacterium symbiont of Bathyaustriella thionipta]|nr:SHOCT domain-containing protein [gamma proteobacterium symbiont of Bathyaustriella thionipta]
MKKSFLSVVLLSSMLLVGGCGGSDTVVDNSSTTMGQQLIDLKASYDKGIINKDEYEAAKEKIMERYN